MQAVTATGFGSVNAETPAGAVSFMDGVNSTLNTALNAWAQYEQIQGIKNTNGQALVQDRLTPTYDNGAAAPVDATSNTLGQQQSKAFLDKAGDMLGVSGQLVAGGLVAIGLLWYVTR
ncbi:hypothetical protein AAOGI_06820 [Agarivorans albus]